MDVFHDKSGKSTVLAATVDEINNNSIKLSWSVAGEQPKSYTVKIANNIVFEGIDAKGCEIPVQGLSKGIHTITLTANDAHTYYPLSKTEFDDVAANPLPAEVILTVKL